MDGSPSAANYRPVRCARRAGPVDGMITAASMVAGGLVPFAVPIVRMRPQARRQDWVSTASPS
ncbi:hypothetical protein GCM10023199_57840 [Actinomycetospora chibensis]